jgi:exodeoxyribonuclease VII small subunit
MPTPKATKPTAALAATLPASYEEALQELDRLVGALESGQMPLDQVLSGYQRGAVLLQFCRDKLSTVEQQIEVLDGGNNSSNGGTLKPWKPE